MDVIHINEILRNDEGTSKLPNILQNYETPAVCCWNKSLNQDDVVSNNNVNDLEIFGAVLRDCSCKESQFVNRDHGHITTGDLRFIENKHLRKLK